MGISCKTRNTYSLLPLLLLLILIITPSTSSFSPTDIVTKEFLNELCSDSVSFTRRFCVTWLTAGHKTTSMNIHRLLELAVEKNRAFGLENQALMSDFARVSGNDPQLKKSYESCVNSYGISIKEFERAKELLSKSSFQLAYYAADKAFTYALACKDEFEGPSNESSLALNRSEKFITVCHIVWNLAQLLD